MMEVTLTASTMHALNQMLEIALDMLQELEKTADATDLNQWQQRIDDTMSAPPEEN